MQRHGSGGLRPGFPPDCSSCHFRWPDLCRPGDPCLHGSDWSPLLWAILSSQENDSPRPLRRAFLLSYVCGVLWYAGNCYWVRDVMLQYGDMPPLAPDLLLLGFSLVLGAYFGLFGLAVALVRKATKSTGLALVAAPVFWAALELAAARITSVPWDQLGYSQVDNSVVNQLAPWTGVYGISFLLVAVNALIAAGLTLNGSSEETHLRGDRNHCGNRRIGGAAASTPAPQNHSDGRFDSAEP